MPTKELDIQPFFTSPVYSKTLSSHITRVRRLLRKILPKNLLEKEPSKIAEWLNKHLPLIKWGGCLQFPDTITISLLCAPPPTIKPETLFLDLLKKWLIPEKEIEILSMSNMSFYLKGINTHHLHLIEVEILVERGRDYATIQTNLPLLEKELSLSLTSSKYAEYILNTKALSYEQKSTIVHQELRRIFHRYSSHFDHELFVDMSRLLALSQTEFRSIRPARQITRLVVSHYLMRKQLMRALNKFPEKRHLMLRFMATRLHFPFGSKEVLGMVLAIGLIDKYENFDEAHIGLAVQKFIPDAQIVKGSFCTLRGMQDPVRGVYVELEKKNDATFCLNEVHLLKLELEGELKKRIEKLIPSVFMIRNEEETMRSILLLSQELRDLADLPQVMISFDKQTDQHLIFTVILVRLLKKKDAPLKECFHRSLGAFEFTSDRVQNIGYLHKTTPKEANVFHLSIPKVRALLRADSSVNFYLARQQVVSLLTKAVGEVRDYNGGMILKQGELFSQFKLAFSEIAQKNEELLENFFFGLSPIEMQATLPAKSLEVLFKLFLEAMAVDLAKKEHYFLKTMRKAEHFFATLCVRDPSLEEDLNNEFLLLDHFSRSLVKTKVDYQGHTVLGYIYESADSKKQKKFQNALQRAIKKWTSRVQGQQELRLSFIFLPPSLDPRQGGDDQSETLFKLLFDGLTRITSGNKPVLSVAKSVEITSDLKQYTFHLRPSYWSNGTRVVAYDFEYAWKKVLSPHFKTQFAYMFYPIKNARLAKEGKVGLDSVGARAIDEATLVVELEHPTPEFLELIAHALYSPVSHQLERIHPNWSQGGEEAYVCNGPFKLKKIYPNGGFELIKNPTYWDCDAVQLERIFITKDNSIVANEMFKNDETDWLGRPLRPWESSFGGSNEIVNGTPIFTSWCVFNTQRFPFHSTKMRQAFALAVDRNAMYSLFLQGGIPAVSPLPFAHTQFHDKPPKCDLKHAAELFEEALQELGLKRKDFPITTIICAELKSREKVAKALQKQFQDVFGIHCRIESYPFPQLFSKITKGEHQIGTISWKAWSNDPMYTLNTFKYRNDDVNFAKWEHFEFQKLLDAARSEFNPSKHLELVKEAEKILISEAPVIPLFYEVNNYIHKDYLKGVVQTHTGNIDFKWTSIVKK